MKKSTVESGGKTFRELLLESGLFDGNWYLERYSDVAGSGLTAIEHFIAIGSMENRDPGPDFDTEFYRIQHPWGEEQDSPFLERFLRSRNDGSYIIKWPATEKLQEDQLIYLLNRFEFFDAEWYLSVNKDVSRAKLDPLLHFVRNGASEWRDPNPSFNTTEYAEKNEHIDFSLITPVEYYLRSLKTEPGSDAYRKLKNNFRSLLISSNLFDPDWYKRSYNDVKRSDADPLNHYVKYGAAEGRDPGPEFDSAFYTEKYPQIHDFGLNAIEHYLSIGQYEGLDRRPISNYRDWLSKFDELTETDWLSISDDSKISELPGVLIVKIRGLDFDSDSKGRCSWEEQIGVNCLVVNTGPSDQQINFDGLLQGEVKRNIVILCGEDVVLRPHAAYVLGKNFTEDTVDVLYSDHDHLGPSGERFSPVFKPEFSPEFLKQSRYIGSMLALKLDVLGTDELTKLLAEASGQDLTTVFSDFVLKIRHRSIKRIPFLLYSSLRSEDCLGEDMNRSFLEPVRDRRCLRTDGTDRTQREPSPVHIIIPTRDRIDLLKPCIDSILDKTDYPIGRLHIIVVDNDSSQSETLEYFRTLDKRFNCRVIRSSGKFNFAKICNDGAASADDGILLFLNNDTTVIDPHWVTILSDYARRPEIGVVGAQLLYPDNTIQHGGVVLGLQGVGGHRLIGVDATDAEAFDVTREMTAVTGACLAVRKTVFDEVCGFDEALKVAFNDVLLCSEVFKAGYRNLYVAQPLLYHHESKSRGYDTTRDAVLRNLKEAVYARERFSDLFRDDPSYNPNLSLQKVGELAAVPRVTRPWRRSASRRTVLIVSNGHGIGHGVGCVVAVQASAFLRRGWEVTIGGPVAAMDRVYPECRRVKLTTALEAAVFAVSEGMDCVIAHTPPFFSMTRYLGNRPLFYAYDHGEPPPVLFVDHEARDDIDREKRFCAPFARRVFTISRSVYEQQFRQDAVIVRNGNDHLATWSADWASQRLNLRRKFGFEGSFIVFNVCRFHKEERLYKGLDAYINIASELPFLAPDVGDRVVFVLAGRGEQEDVEYVSNAGLRVFSNVTDLEMAELYAASDLYVNLSTWEGYNLGIGQALAMGLDVIASDIPAHREFGVSVSNSTLQLCVLIGDAVRKFDGNEIPRAARLEKWEGSMEKLSATVENDLAFALTTRS